MEAAEFPLSHVSVSDVRFDGAESLVLEVVATLRRSNGAIVASCMAGETEFRMIAVQPVTLRDAALARLAAVPGARHLSKARG